MSAAIGAQSISRKSPVVMPSPAAFATLMQRAGAARPDVRIDGVLVAPMLRGTAVGSVLGILPGGGHILASFASYSAEKRLSKHPEEFGHGAIEGVAGPEAANNASATGTMVPLLALGLPTSATAAMMLAGGPCTVPYLHEAMEAGWQGDIAIDRFLLPLAGISTIKEIKDNPIDVRATGRLNKLYVELLRENPAWAKDDRRSDMNHFMARLR